MRKIVFEVQESVWTEEVSTYRITLNETEVASALRIIAPDCNPHELSPREVFDYLQGRGLLANRSDRSGDYVEGGQLLNAIASAALEVGDAATLVGTRARERDDRMRVVTLATVVEH